MADNDNLGQLEQIILLAVMRLEQEAYGMKIRREIAMRTQREVAIGAVYATLERLEMKGYVQSHYGEATALRGGRAKKYFTVSGPGQQALIASQVTLAKMREGLDPIFGY